MVNGRTISLHGLNRGKDRTWGAAGNIREAWEKGPETYAPFSEATYGNQEQNALTSSQLKEETHRHLGTRGWPCPPLGALCRQSQTLG